MKVRTSADALNETSSVVLSSGKGRLVGEFDQPDLPALVAHQVLCANADRLQRVAIEGLALDVNAEIVLRVAYDHALESEFTKLPPQPPPVCAI